MYQELNHIHMGKNILQEEDLKFLYEYVLLLDLSQDSRHH